MSFLDLFRTILANLNRMRIRVILTAIGVVIGTAAVLVLISLGAGLQRSATEGIGGISDLTIINVVGQQPVMMESAVSRDGSAPGVSGAGRNEPQGLTLKVLEKLRALPHVVAVTPQEFIQGQTELRYNRLVGGAGIMGVDPEAWKLFGYKLASGENRIGTGQVVVGAQIGSTLYDPRQANQKGGISPFGGPGGPGGQQTVDLQDASLTLRAIRYDNEGKMATRNLRVQVTGVLAALGETDYNLYVPLKDIEELNQWLSGRRIDRNREGYQQAVVKVASSRDVADVQKEIRQMGFNAYSAQDAVNSINSFFIVLQAILGGIGAIALLVAAFGIANTLSMAIYERTREIGLMKAIGARNRDVMSIFLGEAAAIGFLGGVVGTGLGWAVSGVINLIAQSVFGQQGNPIFGGPGASSSIVYTPVWLIPFAVLFATLVGLLSGVFPALRAATLDPLKALKYE